MKRVSLGFSTEGPQMSAEQYGLCLFQQREVLTPGETCGAQVVQNNKYRHSAIARDDDRTGQPGFRVDAMIAFFSNQGEPGELKDATETSVREGCDARHGKRRALEGHLEVFRRDERRGTPARPSRIGGDEAFFAEDVLQRAHALAFFQKETHRLHQTPASLLEGIATTRDPQLGAKADERLAFLEDVRRELDLLHDDGKYSPVEEASQIAPQKGTVSFCRGHWVSQKVTVPFWIIAIGLALVAAQPASAAVFTDVIKNRAGTLTYNVPKCATGHTDNGDGTCTTTFYASVDGHMSDYSQTARSWLVVHAAAGTDVTQAGTTTLFAGMDNHSSANSWKGIYRSIFLFDTSSLPDNAVITAATVSFYGQAKSDTLSLSPTFNVYTAAPASTATLAAGDFDSLGTPALSSDITFANVSTAGYNNFVLNTTELTNMNKTGISMFGGRESKYDAPNLAPASAASDLTSNWTVYTSEEAGTTKDPKLVVTYKFATTLSAAPAVDFQRFTTVGAGNCAATPPTNCWTKPTGVTMVKIEVIGGGGGGGGSHGGYQGGGGGGGALARGVYNAANLPASLTVTVGAGGAAATSAVVGGAGDTSSVTSTNFTLSAFGGGGGANGSGGQAKQGGAGGGGGTGGAGVNATTDSGVGGGGGNPTIQGASIKGNQLGGSGGGGGWGTTNTGEIFTGGNAEFGGGGGGGADGRAGGSSLFCAGGGGGGSGSTGGAGGAWGSYSVGGGGAANTAGTSRNFGCGNGGGGGSGSTAAGAGGVPGGGGGGSGLTTAGSNAGAGGRGEVRISAW